jgi:DNA adenine methylase
LPAIKIIKRYNTPDVFIYVDPPYPTGTRKPNLYKHEMSDRDHEELLLLLLDHPGKVIISGYENDMYNDFLGEWRKEHKRTQAEAGVIRTETIWLNYTTEQMNLFNNRKGGSYGDYRDKIYYQGRGEQNNRNPEAFGLILRD